METVTLCQPKTTITNRKWMEVRKWSTGNQVGQWNIPSDLEEVLVQNTKDIDSDDETDNSQTNVSYDYSDSDEDSDEEFNLEF